MNLNALAGTAIGIYVLAVIVRGNGQKLIDQLKTETGFLKWGIAVIILSSVWKSGYLGGSGNMFAALVIIGLLMAASSKTDFSKQMQILVGSQK